MRHFKLAALVALAVGLAAQPSDAATTTLDFAGAICGASGNLACVDGLQIGQSYGDSAMVDVSYRSIDNATNLTSEAFLKYWSANYGDLTGVVWGGGDPVNFRSEIRLIPTAGFEISLLRLDAGCYFNRASCQTLNYDIRSASGAAIAVGSTPTLFPGHAMLAVNSAYFSDGIVLGWGPDGYDTGLDNIAFDVRAIGAVGGVPEPASWALMIGGFGLVGGAMRRRGGLVTIAA